jgi:arylsulfatase A-like enzyme
MEKLDAPTQHPAVHAGPVARRLGRRRQCGTPALDRLAARGVRFLRAICPSPICGPSRACLASGYEHDRAGVRNNGYSASPETPNVYRQLRDAGQHVMTCGKLDLLKGEPDWGEDGQHALHGSSRLQRLASPAGSTAPASMPRSSPIAIATRGRFRPLHR